MESFKLSCGMASTVRGASHHSRRTRSKHVTIIVTMLAKSHPTVGVTLSAPKRPWAIEFLTIEFLV